MKGIPLTIGLKRNSKGQFIKKTTWALNYDGCIECETTHRNHVSHGLCTRCYSKWWAKNNPEKIKSKRKKNYWKNHKKSIERSKDWQRRNQEYIKEYRKKYWRKNIEKLKTKRIIYNKKNHEKILKRQQVWQRKPEVIERRKQKYKENSQNPEFKKKNRLKVKWFKENSPSYQSWLKEYQRNWQKEKRNDPSFRLSSAISYQIWKAIKSNKNGRHWEDIVGYTLKDLKLHLERQFKNGMGWKNYGFYWEIDHRIPKSWFKFKSDKNKQFKKCWALENLQPKLISTNRSKINFFAEPTLNTWRDIK